MNNLSLNISQSDTLWYTPMNHHHHHHHQQKPFPLFYTQLSQNDDESDNNSTSNNHNNYTSVGPTNDNRSETASSQSHHSDQHHREHMFEKPLTPSDVGKLNRLVIPKQHAEKYFPLAGVSSSTAASASVDGGGGGGGGGGGVILGFEDETGKCWRFRYSYWNSSQSYVLTKGWSRYVKEKKLDAGDVVLFERHRFEPERFFIGWRRRGSGSLVQFPIRVDEFGGGRWTGGGQRPSYYNGVQVRQGYPVPHPHRIPVSSYPYHHPPPDCFHAPLGTDIRAQQESQKAAVRSSDGGANSKTLRLFGVNLECQLDDASLEPEPEPEQQTSDGSSISSQGAVHGSGSGSAPSQGFVGPTGYNYFDYENYPHHHNHMDINYNPQDGNQMRNRLG